MLNLKYILPSVSSNHALASFQTALLTYVQCSTDIILRTALMWKSIELVARLVVNLNTPQ